MVMFEIIANEKGSRHILLTDAHLETIKKYALFHQLVDSNGYVDDVVLEKLQMNVRALIEQEEDNADLVTLCHEVIYHDNMKPFALQQLLLFYSDWVKLQ